MRHPDGTVAFGPTHFFALESRAYDELPDEVLEQIEEGFLTSHGCFVDRAEAERIYLDEPTQADLDWLPEGASYYDGTLHTGDMEELPGYRGRRTGRLAPGATKPEPLRRSTRARTR